MKQIIELRDTEKRKMIAETFGISLANLSQILRFKRNGKNAGHYLLKNILLLYRIPF